MTKQNKRKLICLVVAISPFTTLKYGGYAFGYSKDLKPIPVEVDSEVAEMLLEMVDKPCRCHRSVPKPLFKEIKG